MKQPKDHVATPSPPNRTAYRSRPHDVHNLYVSLKQWRILHAVVDCGGFAEAAKYLHLSQSAVSYTVAKLQEQLGVSILKIEGRKAQLTATGRALLDRSRQVLKEAVELESFARNLGQGWGAEVRLMVDHHFPAPLLMRALREFSAEQGAHVRLSEAPMSRADEALRDLAVDLAISAHVPLGLLGEPLMELEYAAVAHPHHPLFQLERALSAADLVQHVQIGFGNACRSEPERADSVWECAGDDARHARRWNVSSFDRAIEAVREGLGYAWLPTCRIKKCLDQGLLAALPIREGHTVKTMLYLIHGRPRAAGHAASRLAELLRHAVSMESHAPEEGDSADMPSSRRL